MTIKIEKITIFPIKSLEGIDLDEAVISGATGVIVGDREFAFITADGETLDSRKYPKIHTVSADFDLEERLLTVSDREFNHAACFHLDTQRDEIAQWFSEFLGVELRLEQDTLRGFQDSATYGDDQKIRQISDGPSIVSDATLAQLSLFMPDENIGTEGMHKRHRANIQVSGVEAFWEDGLFGDIGEGKTLTFGDGELIATGPIARCSITTKDPETGDVIKSFAKTVVAGRKSVMAGRDNEDRFKEGWLVAAYTAKYDLPKEGITISVGDEIIASDELKTVPGFEKETRGR